MRKLTEMKKNWCERKYVSNIRKVNVKNHLVKGASFVSFKEALKRL